MSKAKKKFSAWNLIWLVPAALVLAVVLVLGVMMYLIPACETVSSARVTGSADWMSALPDDMPLSDVVIPGTHDSATKNVQLAYFSKCQALSIGEQLDAGFRYLDIRLGDSEGFPLMHGFTHCTAGGFPWSNSLMLADVLEECYAFLEAHPTETVIFCVKHEHGDEPDAVFAEELKKVLDGKSGLWYAGESLPTVGEARGRLVLLKRFNDGGILPGIAFNWIDQGGFDEPEKNAERNENPTLTLFVQDRYEYEADEKWAAFTAGMKAAEDGAAGLNFLSTKGNAKYGHPFKYAPGLNKKLMGESDLTGWIVVDFGSAELAKHVYERNFN